MESGHHTHAKRLPHACKEAYVQFAGDWRLSSRENCLCGRQLLATFEKFACTDGHNTVKPPVFCNGKQIHELKNGDTK